MAKKKTLPQTMTITRDEHEPESAELIAAAILKIAHAFEQLQASRLRPNLTVLLLHDMTKVPKKEINKILKAAPLLVGRYLK